jgi:hypothetical protein
MIEASYSESDLLDFLDMLASTHLVKRNTVDSWKTASQKILDVMRPEERADLRNLDVDAIFRRFENRDGKRYKPSSLRVYKSRFSTALDQFARWRDNPSGYRPDPRDKKSDTKPTARPRPSIRQRERRLGPSPTDQPLERITAHVEPEGADTITLPVPLRPGVMIKIVGLPVDLSGAEAKRLASVLAAYAVTNS